MFRQNRHSGGVAMAIILLAAEKLHHSQSWMMGKILLGRRTRAGRSEPIHIGPLDSPILQHHYYGHFSVKAADQTDQGD